ncbi:hypothetical protein [Allopontixanthobacter sp.]|uniref:hypothetical protein n=1 Tax=Allopontixanthobacter sp. TaxID=2906452 RepID=UPI002ABA26F3|nr:hypothetical protein [Allopontixanthobacter sp.]MDZ4306606.1 hypothetical protein [Allopontixanthobacter sp.]
MLPFRAPMMTKRFAAAGGVLIPYVGGKTNPVIASNTLAETIDLTSGFSGGIDTAPSEDDLVLLFFSIFSTSDRNVSVTSSGWTEIADLYGNDARDSNLGIYYKFMGATPDTSVTLGTIANENFSAVAALQVWRGVDQTTPLDVAIATAVGGNTGRPDPPSITPVTAGSVVSVVGAAAGDSFAALTSSDLDNFIQLISVGGVALAIVAAGSMPWSGGAVDPALFGGGTEAVNASWTAASIALRPA